MIARAYLIGGEIMVVVAPKKTEVQVYNGLSFDKTKELGSFEVGAKHDYHNSLLRILDRHGISHLKLHTQTELMNRIKREGV